MRCQFGSGGEVGLSLSVDLGYYYWQQPMTNSYVLAISLISIIRSQTNLTACLLSTESKSASRPWLDLCELPLKALVGLGKHFAFSLTKQNPDWYFRPGDNLSQCAQGYNCPPPTVNLESFSVFQSRYVDVGAGGPSPFTFEVSSNVSWIGTSPSSGSISPNNPEERVFFNVKDWSSLDNGVSTAQITFTGTAKDQPSMSVAMFLNAAKMSVPGDFHGM